MRDIKYKMCCGSKVLRGKKDYSPKRYRMKKDDSKSQLERKFILCNPFKRTPTEFSIRSKCSSRRINLSRLTNRKHFSWDLRAVFVTSKVSMVFQRKVGANTRGKVEKFMPETLTYQHCQKFFPLTLRLHKNLACTISKRQFIVIQLKNY